MADPLIELHQASIVIDDARILDSLSLAIDAGEHTAILGPNGAGKSTLMKLLALEIYPSVDRPAGSNRTRPTHVGGVRADPPDAARVGRVLADPPDHARVGRVLADPADEPRSDHPPIRLFGRERWDVSELRTQMGIVSADVHDRFVHGNSNGSITALDAVTSGYFATQGVFGHQEVTGEMRDRAGEALARMGVTHLTHVTIDRMSTGEARRVLIARALVRRPRLLVLDEPTRGLDLVARHAFMDRVRAIASLETTLLLVTHYLDEIIPEIDRVILLDRGRIVADGRKRNMVTADRLGALFGARLDVSEHDGYFTATVRGLGADGGAESYR
jgi:iron complex transport system ATP-binding protein